MLKAVIFDMDGVIIDSEPMHARAALLVLEKYNVNITIDYIHQFIGSTTRYMCQKMIDDFQINTTIEELLAANNEMKTYLLKKEGHTVIPFITDLMKNLYENDVKMIIASSSPAYAIEEVMDTLNIKEYFQGYVSGTMVAHPKPAPDIFLLAAERLEVAPEECLVIEDSNHGVNAAVAAKMTCIGFVNPNSGNQDLHKATMLVEGFEEVDYHFIKQVYQYDHLEPAVILTTEHVIIRELSIDDIDDLYDICQKPEIHKFIDGFQNLEEEKAKHKAYIEAIYHFYGYGLWGVFSIEDNRLIGRCGIELKQLDGEDIVEIGYLLDPAYQGKGLAKEFIRAILNYCKEELDIHRIVAVIDKDNIRSQHLAEQVGMVLYGETVRNHLACNKYEINL